MTIDLSPIVQSYIDASNAHDVKSIVSCFSADAVVRDENATHRGKIDIERWIATTIEKYKFRFEPLSTETRDGVTVVSVAVREPSLEAPLFWIISSSSTVEKSRQWRSILNRPLSLP